MLRKTSVLAAILGSLILLCVSSQAIASEDIALTSLADSKTSLQAFRDDEKFTLLMIRYHGCGPCDTSEIDMQTWYEQQDAQKVSTLIINIDEPDRYDAVRNRVSSAGINIPGFFIDDTGSFKESIQSIIGEPYRAVPLFILFGPEGDHLGSHVGLGFDWQSMSEMLAASDSGLLQNDVPAAPATMRESVTLQNSVRGVSRYLLRGDYLRADNWINSLRSEFPESNIVKIVTARFLMLNNREADGSLLKYSIKDDAAQEAESLLLSVLENDSTNQEATSVLAELYTVEQQLDKANATMIKASDTFKTSQWANYNRAMYAFVRNRHSEAMEHLSPMLQYKLDSNTPTDVRFRFQQAWKLAKRIGDSNHTFDPIHIIRNGLVERVLEDEVLETLEEKISSDIPTMLIITSEDPQCGFCIDVASSIEPFVRDNKDKYQFLYVSIEPWRQISYQPWMGAIPKVKGVPEVAVFSRGRYMITASIPAKEEMVSYYEKLYPRFLSENLALFNFEKQAAIGNRNAVQQLWHIQKKPISAFAWTLSNSDYAWAAYDSATGSQNEADKLALEGCQKFAKEKGIKQECRLYGKTNK